MTDYGQDIKLGVFVTPTAEPIEHAFSMVQLADALGYDLATLQDHPYQAQFGDTWTMLAALGARTEQIHLSGNVINLPLRPPVVLAKAAATLDLITNGRVEMGIGAGLFWDAMVAAGAERKTAGQSIEALAEAIDLMRQFWAGGTLRFEGEYYQAKGLHAGPRPAHDIPIWVGGLKPRMLRFIGRSADGWAPSMGYAKPDQIAEMSEIVDEAALAAGRDPAEITRLYNINGQFGTGAGLLQGTPEDWAEQLTEITMTNGSSTYVLATDDPGQMQVFANEVGPRLKEMAEAERRSASNVAGAEPLGDPDAEETTASTDPESVTLREGDREAASPDLDGDEELSWPSGLSVLPTPDDQPRLTGTLDWDEASRPTAVQPEETDHPYEAAASHFMDVHNHLRRELDQVRDVLRQVKDGVRSVGAARSAINQMTLRQNNWTLGAFCENYCSTVTGHHTLEDRGVFPHLRRAEPDLAPVLDRLEEEHVVIHDVLTAFDKALVGLVGADGTNLTTSDALEEVQHQLDLLTDTLTSHFSYEERELLPAMARVGLQ